MQFWFDEGAVLVGGCRYPTMHRRNDTGHWRGSNDSQKISVRNWLRALPAGALLSCSGKKVRKVVRLKGKTTHSRLVFSS